MIITNHIRYWITTICTSFACGDIVMHPNRRLSSPERFLVTGTAGNYSAEDSEAEVSPIEVTSTEGTYAEEEGAGAEILNDGALYSI